MFKVRKPIRFLLVRRKGFVRRTRKNLLSFLLMLLFFFLILILIFNGVSNQLMPTVLALSEAKAKYIATEIATDVVNQKLKDLNYNDLIFLQRDANEKITALQTDIVEMNKISAEIATAIQERMAGLDSMYVQVPLGNIFGNSFLSNRGPKITIKIIPYGNIDVDFKTEFTSAGINQTRHKISIEIKSRMLVIVPLVKKGSEIVTRIPVAETVIVGEVPDSFINVETKH